jgi:hypothetical protein
MKRIRRDNISSSNSYAAVPMGRSGSSKDRRRKTSKETSGRTCSPPMQRSRSLREKLSFNDKEKGSYILIVKKIYSIYSYWDSDILSL